MPLWVMHNINEAELCDAVLPKALAYTLTCINSNGVMHLMQISKINSTLHPFISYLPATVGVLLYFSPWGEVAACLW
jgi:hypothetical protein